MNYWLKTQQERSNKTTRRKTFAIWRIFAELDNPFYTIRKGEIFCMNNKLSYLITIL